MSMRSIHRTATEDSLSVPAQAIKWPESGIDLPWVIKWSRGGIDALRAAWDKSTSPVNMSTIVAECGEWDAAMIGLFGGSPDDEKYSHHWRWHAAEILARAELKNIEYELGKHQKQYWEGISGSDFQSVLDRVTLEAYVSRVLLVKRIKRSITPPSMSDVMNCLRLKRVR